VWSIAMINAPVRTVFDVITDFLASQPTPEELLAYHLPDDLQERLEELLDRNGEDLLTSDEREELQEFLNAETFFSLLKTKIKLKLRQRAADNQEDDSILGGMNAAPTPATL
jgi:hypothetical protein